MKTLKKPIATKSSIPEEVLQKYGLKGVHPAADLFPLMKGAEFDAFCDDVKERGIMTEIFTDKRGILIDGRNRLLAAAKVGAKCYKYTKDFSDEDALNIIISMNLQRRHLDAGQRAMIAEQLANIPRGGDREKQRANLPLAQTSVKQAAKQMQVSPRAVKMARAVRKKAAPGVIEMVQNGEMTLNAAHDTIKEVSLEPEITVEELLIEDSFERAKRVTDGVVRFVKTLVSLKMPSPWEEIAPELYPKLKEAIEFAIIELEGMEDTCPIKDDE